MDFLTFCIKLIKGLRKEKEPVESLVKQSPVYLALVYNIKTMEKVFPVLFGFFFEFVKGRLG